MQSTRTRIVLFIYNFAVVVSGMWVGSTYNIQQGVMLFGIAGVLGLLWTVYFEFSLIPRLETIIEQEEPDVEQEQEQVPGQE